MNPLLQKVVDALRSGKYPQAKGHLRTEQGYCCLGVMCAVADDDPQLDDGQDYRTRNGAIDVLPSSICRALGLTNQNPAVVDVNGEKLFTQAHSYGYEWPLTLAWLNDEGFTFDQIADIIASGHIA